MEPSGVMARVAPRDDDVGAGGDEESKFWIGREPKVLGELELELELATLSGESPLPQRSRRFGGI